MSWVGDGADGFGVDHLPYGVFVGPRGPRIGIAIGSFVLDAAAAAAGSEFEALLGATNLNPLLAAGRATWTAVRTTLQQWLTDPAQQDRLSPLLADRARLRMLLPFEVADYVDFYACENHAANVGRIFRPDSEPLPPNWKHLPIGYHGRAGTVVVSGTEIVRPTGQIGLGTFGPTARLDVEAELGFVVGVPSPLGARVALQDFRDHVFGLCLLNDWSARDIQAWEYVPLGPFLGKSFGTSISPWITPLDALDDCWISPPARDVPLLAYLDDAGRTDALAIQLRLSINETQVSTPPFDAMYWTLAQMLAHLTVNGASLRTGDLYASGTISGPEPGQRGALIELTWNGRDPITLADGSTRNYLLDGDEVVITATAPGAGGSILTLGEVRGQVAPATARPTN